MKRIVLPSAALLASLALVTPATADPVKSPNSQEVVFTCAEGVLSVITIAQNRASAAQVLAGGSGVFHLTRVVAPDGTIAVPAGPGTGVTPVPDRLRAATLHTERFCA